MPVARGLLISMWDPCSNAARGVQTLRSRNPAVRVILTAGIKGFVIVTPCSIGPGGVEELKVNRAWFQAYFRMSAGRLEALFSS